MFARKPAPPPPGQLVPATSKSTAVGTPEKSEGTFVLDAISSDGVVVIGRGTKIVGEIRDCAKLEIQGTVDGTVVADAVVIRDSGVLKGDLQAAHAEIHGRFEGRLDVKDVLDIRSNGRVEGELAYGRLAVAMGGHIAGQVSSEGPESPADSTPIAVGEVPTNNEVPRLNGHANSDGGYLNGSGSH